VIRAVHGGRDMENRDGGDLLTGADMRSMAWTKCKARGVSFYRGDTGSGWDGMGWWLALEHGRTS
jgi:hypothetical protein